MNKNKPHPWDQGKRYLLTKSIAADKRISDKLFKFFNGGIPRQVYLMKDIEKALTVALHAQSKEMFEMMDELESCFRKEMGNKIKERYGVLKR